LLWVCDLRWGGEPERVRINNISKNIINSKMIYIYGDSHGMFNMKNFDLPHTNISQPSITMYRIGRDNKIINFDTSHLGENNTYIFFYGEVDCRCHIGKQISLGCRLEDIIKELVSKYFKTIGNNIRVYRKIIICSITPPSSKNKYESIHGPITHEFPFIGTDEERVLYTKEYGYIFLDIYEDYSDSNGLLIFKKSDTNVHINDNKLICEKVKLLI
jgi:hypothetical protein